MLARRFAVILVGLAVLALAAQAVWHRGLDYYGGHWRYAPEDAPWVLSDAAKALVKKTFADAGDGAVVDHGAWVLTLGRLSGSTFVNRSRPPGGTTPGPVTWLSRQLRAQAAGIARSPQPDAVYISRLLRQIDAMPGPYRLWLQAEQAVDTSQASSAGRSDNADSGTANSASPPPSRRPMVSNRYVDWLAAKAPTTLQPVLSIAPEQPDRLARWEKAKVRHMRWNPARVMASGDPSNQSNQAAQALFKTLAKHHISLQIAVGEQHAADGSLVWIAPSIAEPALMAGVSVELTLGGPTGAGGEQLMPAVFSLLGKHDKGDALTVSLAGVMAGDRIDSELRPLLQHPQFYSQLVYASDYPDSAAPGAVDLDTLVDQGFIDAGRRATLREIYRVNPLLFVLATMRSLHLPDTRLALPAAVFFGS